MKNKLSLLFALITFQAIAQTIPADRRFNWQHSGYEGTIPSPVQIIDITAFGGLGDGITDNINFLFNAVTSSTGRRVIYFPPGNYVFNSSIAMTDSIILRGASADSTTLTFDFNGTVGNGINIQGTTASNFDTIISGAERFSNSVVIHDASIYSAGDYAEIQQANGSWDTQPISWADNSVGQIMKISHVSGDTLFFDEQLRINYDYSLSPKIHKLNPKREVGIECLKITRRDSVHVGVCFNIYLGYAVNCWIKGVESSKSIGSHIETDACTDLSIVNNYIHDNFEYDGTSTHGYGITLFGHTGQCRVENNIMRHLRHSFSMQCGANGNVIAYNYSLEPNRSEVPANFGADISMHGHYTYGNLFEGNIVQNIQIDQTWGPTGPFNTFFRNRAELYGIVMSSGSVESDSLNFVGNEVINTTILMGNYLLTGADHFQFGNNIKGTLTPAGTTPLPDSSYYLDSLPTFWTSSNFPTIGIPNTIGSGSNPAKERYLSGIDLASCNDPLPNSTSDLFIDENFIVYPNPFTNELTMTFESEKLKYILISLADLQGRIVIEKTMQVQKGINKIKLATSEVKNGIYLLQCDGKKIKVIK